MTAITTSGSGNWSSTTPNAPWPSGTIPVEGDTVIIATGHTVTINQNVTVGSDPGFGGTAAIAITGVLQFDTTASRTLTLKGDLRINSGGQLLVGTSASRVPVANTITIRFNYSAALVTGKYGLRVPYSTVSVFKAYGAIRTTNTTLASQANSGQAVIVVNDATGWSPGDLIEIASTGGSAGTTGQMEEIAIASGGVSGNTITLASNLTYNHASGAHISNLTKNIVLTSYNASNGWFADTRFGTASNHVLDNSLIQYTAAPSTAISVVSGYSVNGANSGESSKITVADSVFYRPTTNSLVIPGSFGGRNSTITNSCFCSTGGVGTGIYFQAAAYNNTVQNCNFYRLSSGITSGSSTGGEVAFVSGCNFVNINTAINLFSGSAFSFSNCTINGCSSATLVAYLFANFTGIGLSYGNVVANTRDINVSDIFYGDLTFTNTNFQSGTFINGQQNLMSGSHVTLLNCTQGASTNVFKRYITDGVFIKDSTTFKNSISSVRLDTLYSAISSYSFQFLAKNGLTYTLRGNMRYSSTYDDGAYTLP